MKKKFRFSNTKKRNVILGICFLVMLLFGASTFFSAYRSAWGADTELLKVGIDGAVYDQSTVLPYALNAGYRTITADFDGSPTDVVISTLPVHYGVNTYSFNGPGMKPKVAYGAGQLIFLDKDGNKVVDQTSYPITHDDTQTVDVHYYFGF
jgi:hypothetical protein